MASSKEILDNLYELLYELKKSIIPNSIIQLDEVNTILHIYAVREEIDKTTNEKYKQDCRGLLNELEIHLTELQRRNDRNLSHQSMSEFINYYKGKE